MERITVLLIDQRLSGTQSDISRILTRHASVHYVSGSEYISDMIERLRPDVLCFEYDDPGFEGLTVLRETKKRFPSIPILLFTERGSEALAVWALRSRVWDYFVSPVAEKELLQRIRSLSIVAKRSSNEISRRLFMPPTQLPSEERLSVRSDMRILQAAVDYIDGHFREQILQHTLAQTQCARICI